MMTMTAKRLGAIRRASRGLRGLLILLFMHKGRELRDEQDLVL
jgi:hypothetical protein